MSNGKKATAHRKRWPRNQIKIIDVLTLSVAAIALASSILTPVYLQPWLQYTWSGEGRIREIIDQEAEFVLERKTDKAVLLFNDQAFVMDGAGGDINRQTIWTGKSAIANRYENLSVFTYLKHDAVDVTFNSAFSYARAIASTIAVYEINGTQVKISGDQSEKWIFEKISGEWKIASFTYNLP